MSKRSRMIVAAVESMADDADLTEIISCAVSEERAPRPSIAASIANLPRPPVRLTGRDGRLAVLGAVSAALAKAGWTSAQVDAFMDEATAGDYAHLLRVCAQYAEVR